MENIDALTGASSSYGSFQQLAAAVLEQAKRFRLLRQQAAGLFRTAGVLHVPFRDSGLHSNGTYPNEYTRYYAGQLLEEQGVENIDALTPQIRSSMTANALSCP